MNNYVVINGKRYKTPSDNWSPEMDKPATVRKTLAGSLDVTYGPGSLKKWAGEIEAPITASDPWGCVDDIETALALRESVVFIDHYENTFDAHLIGPFSRRSLSSKWDGATNKIYFRIMLVAE